MTQEGRPGRFVFPPWTNLARPILAITLVAAPVSRILRHMASIPPAITRNAAHTSP